MMDRIIALGLPLAALALLAACGRSQPEEQAQPVPGETGTELAEATPTPSAGEATGAAEPGSDRPLTLDLSTELAEIMITIPPEAAADPALYDRLRAEAEAEAEEARGIAEDDKAARGDIDAPFNMHFLNITWEVAADAEPVLSLLKNTSVFQGGAHPNLYFNVVNWDKERHADIGPADLFTDAAWAALSPAAEQAIMAEKETRLGAGLSDEDYWKEDVVYATAPAAENFELFTLAPSTDAPGLAGGIELHYPPYAVGPYVEGDYHIVIPQSVFADDVAPGYAGLFGGEPAGARN
jgi:hypothetical protein